MYAIRSYYDQSPADNRVKSQRRRGVQGSLADLLDENVADQTGENGSADKNLHQNHNRNQDQQLVLQGTRFLKKPLRLNPVSHTRLNPS